MPFIDPLVRGGETTVLRANQGINKIKSFYGSAGMLRARRAAREVWSGANLKSGGFATKAVAFGAVGGVAGGAYSDDTRSGVLKGAGLGVLGAAGHRLAGSARASKLLRGEISSARSAMERGWQSAVMNGEMLERGFGHWAPGAAGPFTPIAYGAGGKVKPFRGTGWRAR